jgi:hypothetical protein
MKRHIKNHEFPIKPADESSSSSLVLPNHEDNNYKPIVQFKHKSRNKNMLIYGGLVYVQICGEMLLRRTWIYNHFVTIFFSQ